MAYQKTKQIRSATEKFHTWAVMQRLFFRKYGRRPNLGCSLHKYVMAGKLLFADELPKPQAQRELFK